MRCMFSCKECLDFSPTSSMKPAEDIDQTEHRSAISKDTEVGTTPETLTLAVEVIVRNTNVHQSLKNLGNQRKNQNSHSQPIQTPIRSIEAHKHTCLGILKRTYEHSLSISSISSGVEGISGIPSLS